MNIFSKEGKINCFAVFYAIADLLLLKHFILASFSPFKLNLHLFFVFFLSFISFLGLLRVYSFIVELL